MQMNGKATLLYGYLLTGDVVETNFA